VLSAPLEIPDSVSRPAASIIRGLLNRDVAARLGSGAEGKDDVKEHEWFRGLSWRDVEQHTADTGLQPYGGSRCPQSRDFTAISTIFL